MRFFVFTLAICLSFSVFGQDDAAPDYLMSQDFPDSVKTLPLVLLDRSETTFGELLESHKGKKLVIDFWASWCKDCLVGLPSLNKLKKKTAKKNVDYVFISVDKEDKKWRSAIFRHDMLGENYRIEVGWKNTLCNYIGLDWIPRYIVIDEVGRIILPKAITASDKQLFKLLMK